MAFDRTGDEPRPLLPEGLGARLVGGLLRALGYVLVASAIAGWLSLISWSAQDPSLTHATSSLTRNWLGPVGAIVSDLLIQTLGFVSVFTFLGLAFMGFELIVRERIRALRSRAWLLPAAILALAGGASSLPAPDSWPLHHGLGGIIGDAIYSLLAGLLGSVNPARSGAAAGLILLSGGAALMCLALDITHRELALIWARDPRGARQLRKDGRFGRLSAGLQAIAGIGRTARPATAFTPYPSAAVRDGLTDGHAHDAAAAAHRPDLAQRRQPDVASPVATAAEHLRRGDSFDRLTEAESALIAKRFAPSGERAAEAHSADMSLTVKAGRTLGGLMPFRAAEPAWRRPSLNILKRPQPQRGGAEFTLPVLRGSARLLEDVLADFGVKGEVKDIRPGPVVTLFEFEPQRGTKSSRIIALADDIARSMSAVSARVATIPGRNVMGIELPNVRREKVYLRELLESEAWRSSDGQLPVALGKGIGGEPVIADLARMPHLLVAGTTGSGKSVGVNAMILSLLYRLSPADCRLIMIDPKMLELSVYNGIPHLLSPVVTDPHQAAATLAWAVAEMEERYKRMAQLGVRNIEIFNTRVRNARKLGEPVSRTVHTGYDEATGEALYVKERIELEPMPYIVIVVDEFADLMVVAGKEVEGSVQRLAQMARAAGIHLIMATQRPSVDVVTGTIKANFPTRIAFKVASKVDSRTILNEQGAEQLLGAGDMLYSAGSGQVIRVHGPFVSDEEVESVACALRECGEPHYVDALMRAVETASAAAEADGPARQGTRTPGEASDDLYDRAVAIVHRDRKASTSYIQRRLSIGYNRAADLIERMEREGLISPADSVGRRRVLMGEAAPDAAAD